MALRYDTNPRQRLWIYTPVDQYFNISCTKVQIDKIGEDAVKTIPSHHVRIAMDNSNQAMIEYCIRKRRTVKTPYAVGDYIAFAKSVNIGNRNFPYTITMIEYGTITKFSPKTVVVVSEDYSDGVRVNFDKILGRIKR